MDFEVFSGFYIPFKNLQFGSGKNNFAIWGRENHALVTGGQKSEFLKYSGEYRRIPLRIFVEFPGIPILIHRIPWQQGMIKNVIRLLLFKLDFLSSFINLTYPTGNQPIRKSNLESGRNPPGIHPEFRVLEEIALVF
jgi:hypothetical protein